MPEQSKRGIAYVGRVAQVVALWPLVYLMDCVRGVDPPARLRSGLAWARTGWPTDA